MTLTQQRLSSLRKGHVAAIVAIVIVVVFVATRAFVGGPTYTHDKSYTFATTTESTTKTEAGRVVTSRTFVFEDGETFAAPVESAGRQILVADRALPSNSFKLVEREVSPLQIGKQSFDGGGTYIEVRYNDGSASKKAAPRITPKNAGRK